MDLDRLRKAAWADDFDELSGDEDEDAGIELSRPADPLEATTNPRDLAAAIEASKRHERVRQTTSPDDLEAAIAASRAERTDRVRATEAMDEALAESKVYEESRETEARRRRFAAEDAAAAVAGELTALNARTTDRVASLLSGDRDASAALRRCAEAYAVEAAAIRNRSSAAAPARLCRGCNEFHAAQNGLCSSCRARPPQSGGGGCGPGAAFPLGNLFRRLGGGRRARRRLPAPPTPHDRRTGRELLAARLARHGRSVVDVGGDGACQYRAVSHGLWGDESHHRLARSRAMEILRRKPPVVFDCQVYASNRDGDVGTINVDANLDEYLVAMADVRSWGDHNTLQACSDAFRTRILLVTTHKENFELVLEPRDDEAVSEIWIGFHSEMHYVSTE